MEALSDPSLCDESQLMEAKMCMEVGLLCTQLDRNDRPTMADVLCDAKWEERVARPKETSRHIWPRKGPEKSDGC